MMLKSGTPMERIADLERRMDLVMRTLDKILAALKAMTDDA